MAGVATLRGGTHGAVALFAGSNVNTVGYRVENLRTGAVAQGTLLNAVPGTSLPLSTTLLSYRMWRTNNATTLAVGIDAIRFGIETDN